MSKRIGYRLGYRIQIINGFYEVVDGVSVAFSMDNAGRTAPYKK